mgnify:FL=1
MYYEYKFGDYYRAQEKIAAEKKIIEETGEKKELVEERASNQPIAPNDRESSNQGTSRVGINAEGPAGDSINKPNLNTNQKTIRINNGLVEIVLSNKGAILQEYKLTKYADNKNQHIDLIYKPTDFVTEQDRLERIAQENGDKNFSRLHKYPTMGLKFPNYAFSKRINEAFFTLTEQREYIELRSGDKPLRIEYRLADESGVVVTKSYVFYPEDYKFEVEIAVKSTPKWGVFNYSLVWFGLGDEETDFISFYSYNCPIIKEGDKSPLFVETLDETDKPFEEYEGNIKWSALTHRYFTVFAMFQDMPTSYVKTTYISDSDATLEWRLNSTLSHQPTVASFYVGPKTHEQLNKYKDNVSSIINYGWFDILARPMYWLMELFFKWTGNWGWSIILLTVVTKVLFFPLTQRGFKSMQKLQKLQPHMKKLQDVYKDDKEKLNQEMMSLYKEHKVNPVGGCMPLILQIPIFFALYKVLLESIELKGAEWIFWIKDLSLQDPYYITPVFMGASMLIQQMMTPKTGDPMQRKVMMAMPVIFTVMFLQFPSGLVIYWLVNNILTIGQQWLINRETK